MKTELHPGKLIEIENSHEGINFPVYDVNVNCFVGLFDHE